MTGLLDEVNGNNILYKESVNKKLNCREKKREQWPDCKKSLDIKQ